MKNWPTKEINILCLEEAAMVVEHGGLRETIKVLAEPPNQWVEIWVNIPGENQ